MKILIISNMYPSIQKPYSGIFIKNQYEKLREILGGNQIEIKYLNRTFTNLFGSFLKYIRFIFFLLSSYKKRYDVIHFHYFYLSVIFLPYKIFYRKTRFIVTFHGQDIIKLSSNKFLLYFFRFLAKRIDCFIPVGKEISRVMKKKLDVVADYIIPVGVDTSIFFNNPEIVKKYDFIFVGSFYHVKGIDIIIQAIKLLGDNKNEISFCFVGSGDYYLELLKLKEDGFNIDILGTQTHKELSVLYNSSRFLIAHSRSEGFPTSSLEALYCGTPVLASNIPQYREQIIEDKNGWLVELGNISDFLNKILTLKNKSHKQYLINSKHAENSNKKYSLNNVIEKLIKIYKND
ncbi:MAG: hypothetical protein CMD15_03715 [Flavobacteriales bacterium]|nr:hypothetical protein [Flavobacteriales bacterium]|tara:strand:- start:34264 stop:35301 length:1038 start_codon:yes stop_codon:yes gene_type:complete